MKKIIYFSIIITIFSCRTSRFDHSNMISIKEANRIIEDALKKIELVDSSKDIVLFKKSLYMNPVDIIYFDTTKIKKLNLSKFPYFKNNKKVKLIEKDKLYSDNEIIVYWNISFTRSHDQFIYIDISSDFFIPPTRQPIEIYGMSNYFKYKIVNGKAELIRWKGQ